jgi:hypothetical protein
MTAETAFGVHHLLEHLHHTYVPSYWDGSMELNPPILGLLLGEVNDRGAYQFRVGLYWLYIIDELSARLAHLKARELGYEESANFEVLFDFALRAKSRCNCITLAPDEQRLQCRAPGECWELPAKAE